MLFRAYSQEKIRSKTLILIFFFIYILGFYAKYFDFLSSSQEVMRWGEKDSFIHSTLIKSLQVEFKCIITMLL